MTEIDPWKVAKAAAEDHYLPRLDGTVSPKYVQQAFINGFAAAVERLPSRDEIAAISEEHVQCIDWGTEEFEGACFCGWDGEPDEFDHHFADAVLALFRERYEGES